MQKKINLKKTKGACSSPISMAEGYSAKCYIINSSVGYHYANCRYAECHTLIVMQSVMTPSFSY